MRDKKVVYKKNVDKTSQEKAKEQLRCSKNAHKKQRQTVQIRIRKEWHALICKEARLEEITLSRFLDQICSAYFKKSGWRKAKKLSRKTVRPGRPLLE